ncbi:DUF3987 domain-containing protein [Halomonas sp. FME65]|uniref:DUF3987 domain-containing protein n=1 Tax=Halomonas sp. FME65 TaxID=2742614 RepID=UPI001865D1D3|nr:DUF3987 domain-containing protein [Halomonas sp. FME65]
MQYQNHIVPHFPQYPMANQPTVMENPPMVLPQPAINYPTGVEGELFYNIIVTLQQKTKAPFPLCVQAALGVGAFLLQRLYEIKSPSGHTTPASLVIIGILEATGGKSTIMEKFTSIIEAFINNHHALNQDAEKKYLNDKEVWDQTYKVLVRNLAKANAEVLAKRQGDNALEYQKSVNKAKKFENSLEEHRKTAPTPPPALGLGILSDATPAAIPKYIKDNRIKNLAIISAEAEEFLTKGIKNHSSTLNKGFSGEKTNKHLATRGNESHNVPMTTILFGQPYIMEKAFGGENNRMRGTGTIARGLFCCPPSNVGFQHSSGGSIFEKPIDYQYRPPLDDPDAESKYQAWATDLLESNTKANATDASRKQLRLTPAATDLWYRGRAELDLQLRQGGRYFDFQDHGNRLPEQWLRVALVIHGYNHLGEEEISVDTLRLAIDLVNSFSTEFQTIFRPISQEERDVTKVEKWLNEKREQGFRYIGKSFVTVGNPLRPVARLNMALHILTQRGSIGTLAIPCFNSKGQATKSMTVIDLYPRQPENTWNLEQAVYAARQLNQR